MQRDMKVDDTGAAVVPVLACVLNQLCARNDALPNSAQSVSKFHALHPPAISIRDYLYRIAKYSECSGECFVLSLVYIDRIIQGNPSFTVNSLNIHRLLITSVMLSAKFFDDQYYNNAYYAKVGGVPCLEMNTLEVEFLFMANFTLFVTTETYRQYYSELCNHAMNSACGCSSRLVPPLSIPKAPETDQVTNPARWEDNIEWRETVVPNCHSVPALSYYLGPAITHSTQHPSDQLFPASDPHAQIHVPSPLNYHPQQNSQSTDEEGYYVMPLSHHLPYSRPSELKHVRNPFAVQSQNAWPNNLPSAQYPPSHRPVSLDAPASESQLRSEVQPSHPPEAHSHALPSHPQTHPQGHPAPHRSQAYDNDPSRRGISDNPRSEDRRRYDARRQHEDVKREGKGQGQWRNRSQAIPARHR